jgi:heat shock protein HtpX
MTTYDFISSNKRKTTVLIVVFLGLIMFIGWALDRHYQTGGGIMVFAGLYSLGSALTSYFAGDKIALLTTGARRVTAETDPYLCRMVENLCISQGMPAPKVHVIQDPAINAFATGRDPAHASVAVTSGAIQKLKNEELEGVLAHELSHIQNYDIRLMTVVIVLVGMAAMIGDFTWRFGLHGRRRSDSRGNGGALAIIGLVLAILAPIIAQIIKLAVSRRREYLADSSAALMTRYPDGLASALRKIQADNLPMAHASASTAHLFIANPMTGKALANLFSTHPPIEERIKALEIMSNKHDA